MNTIELTRFQTALRKHGWSIQSAERSHFLITRRKGLPRFWVRLGVYLIPIGIGIIILLLHLGRKNLSSPETLKIESSLIESGFYPPLLW